MNSYYGHSYEDYYYQKNHFATASVILGGLSCMGTFTILPAFCFGSLSVLFGILSRKKRQKLTSAARCGITCSIWSIALASVILFTWYL